MIPLPRPAHLLSAVAVFSVAAFALAKGPAPGGGARPRGQKCVDPIPAARQEALLKNFVDKGIDANNDGVLICEEVRSFFKANPQLRPQGHPRHECTDPVPAARQTWLLNVFGDKGIDANKDGALTCEEIKTFFDNNPQLRPPPRPRHHRMCTDPISSARQARLLEKFGGKGIDANNDGALTCDEVRAFFRQNKSNKVTPTGDGQ